MQGIQFTSQCLVGSQMRNKGSYYFLTVGIKIGQITQEKSTNNFKLVRLTYGPSQHASPIHYLLIINVTNSNSGKAQLSIELGICFEILEHFSLSSYSWLEIKVLYEFQVIKELVLSCLVSGPKVTRRKKKNQPPRFSLVNLQSSEINLPGVVALILWISLLFWKRGFLFYVPIDLTRIPETKISHTSRKKKVTILN